MYGALAVAQVPALCGGTLCGGTLCGGGTLHEKGHTPARPFTLSFCRL